MHMTDREASNNPATRGKNSRVSACPTTIGELAALKYGTAEGKGNALSSITRRRDGGKRGVTRSEAIDSFVSENPSEMFGGLS
jgi:hypothetical protein